MEVAPLLLELYSRLPPLAHDAVDGLDVATLTSARAGANTIAWLVWHTARVQDHHVSEILAEDQVWVADDWARGFGLDADPSNTGYGHDARPTVAGRAAGRPGSCSSNTWRQSIGARAPSSRVSRRTDLDRVVDRRWDPPVTLGVRLVSIADDGLQHLGQAAYLRGLLAR